MRAQHGTALASAVLFLSSLFVCAFSLRANDTSTPAPVPSYVLLTGQVTDEHGAAIIGASIQYHSGDRIQGVLSNASGHFSISRSRSDTSQLTLNIHAIGYGPAIMTIKMPKKDQFQTASVQVKLIETVTEVDGVIVTAPRPLGRNWQQAVELRERSRASLVPTNISPSLRDPYLVRSGSMHSGQIRLLGTNPIYSLNGQPIGQDPNHFEAVTLLPSTVITSTSLQAMGTSVSHRQLAAIDLEISPRFEPTHETEIDASTIEVTGTSRYANHNLAGVLSLRQAVVDKVLGNVDANKSIRSIPPTTFTDLFFSGAARLSPHLTLSFDQFSGTDRLQFNTSELFNDPVGNGVEMNQASENLISILKLRSAQSQNNWSVGLSRRSIIESYEAVPSSPAGRLSLDLSGREVVYGLTADGSRSLATNTDLAFGMDYEISGARSLSLHQTNWNFLPPFWNTDNQHPYQSWLNDHYGALTLSQHNGTFGLYSSLTFKPATNSSVELGLRYDRFSELANHQALSYRLQYNLELAAHTSAQFFHGTSAETPVSRLLDPYQVTIRDAVGRLQPIRTVLTAAAVRHGLLTLSMFTKLQTQVPVLAAETDFRDGTQILQTSSNGTADYWGLSLSLANLSLMQKRLTCDLSYTYSQSWRHEQGVTFAHELNSPHHFEGDIRYRASSRGTIGASVLIRSGYPYSPIHPYATSRTSSLDPGLYAQSVAETHSLTFPVNGYVNLFGEYRIGEVVVFCSVSNLTNRANPLVNHPRGFLYDAALLPTIGLKLTL